MREKPESRAQPETRTGGGVWGGGLVSPSPENFCRIESEMVQSGAYFTSKLTDKQTSLICPDADKNPMGSSKIELNALAPFSSSSNSCSSCISNLGNKGSCRVSSSIMGTGSSNKGRVEQQLRAGEAGEQYVVVPA